MIGARGFRYIDTHCNVPNIIQQLHLSSFSVLRSQLPASFEVRTVQWLSPSRAVFLLQAIQPPEKIL